MRFCLKRIEIGISFNEKKEQNTFQSIKRTQNKEQNAKADRG